MDVSKTISDTHGRNQCLFAQAQEGAKKDVEMAFRVLQVGWGIVRGAAMMWKLRHFGIS